MTFVVEYDMVRVKKMKKPIFIKAVDVPDAWFQCIYNIFDDDYACEYIIDKGSFEGQKRREFFYAVIEIGRAYAEPYDLMLPEIPAHLNIPNPVEKGYVEQYLPYLMTDHVEKDEQYSYGERLNACLAGYKRKSQQACCDGQVEYFIRELRKKPNTNQAILQVGKPTDCFFDDPPCLRHVDLRVFESKLHVFPYFRSWDLWGAFASNLAGLAVLQKYMADEIGVGVGKMIASSKGLHLYDYIWELAKLRTNHEAN